MKAHPLSEVFPLMDAAELRTLADDVTAHGLREPVVTYEGMILDGRNRWAACKLAKVKQVPTVPYEGDDPVGYVVSANLHRRHLSVSQRAMIAAEIARLPRGNPQIRTSADLTQTEAATRGNPQIGNIADLSQPDAAKLLGVSTRSVGDAAAVLGDGTPAEIAAIRTGEATVNETARQVRERKQAEEIREAAKADPERFGGLAEQLDDGGDVGKVMREFRKRQAAGTTKAQPLKDQLGKDVPSHLRDLFGDPWIVQAAEAVEAIVRDALKQVKARVERRGTRYKFMLVGEIIKAIDCARTDLEIVVSHLNEARPYAVCPACGGKGCKLCREAGWLTRWRLKELKSSQKI